jgi:hypothetical protein
LDYALFPQSSPVLADTSAASPLMALEGRVSGVAVKRSKAVNVSMNEANSALNEVVVTGYGTTTKKHKKTYHPPAPPEGAESYKEYLQKHVRYPASAGAIRGSVMIAFVVKGDGTLDDFKIIRKLQPDCDEEAIRVVKEGPAWTPASDGKSTRVFVDVPFIP